MYNQLSLKTTIYTRLGPSPPLDCFEKTIPCTGQNKKRALNSQLRDAEESIFCNTKLVGDLLQGFRTFVVRFLIEMSRVRLTIILEMFDVEVSVYSSVSETLTSNNVNIYF